MKASAGNRILMLLENNPYPGDVRVRREARTLVAAGCQVTVISPKPRGRPWHEVVDGVRTYRYPMPRAGDGLVGYLWEYGFSLSMTCVLTFYVFVRRGFDVIHAHNPPDLFVLIAMFYKLFGKRFVFDHHDLSPEMYRARFESGGNRLMFNILVWFEKLTFALADHVIATNESYKRVEMERGKVPEERITIVRNGPDLNRLNPVDPDPELREKAECIIGFVGVMGHQDGLDYLLRSLRHLIHDIGRSDFHCVIIGDGAERKRLLRLASELKLDERVWFTGHISDEDMIRYLCTTDICVDPDPSNEFNDRSTMVKMTEYMALGRPIVAYNLPEHRVTAQEAAVYARANDELDFARQIDALMKDPDRRRQMGQFGRKRVEAELAWAVQEQHLLKAYDKLGVAISVRPAPKVASPSAVPRETLIASNIGPRSS